MSKFKKAIQGPGQKVNTWVENSSSGKEKSIVVILIVFSFFVVTYFVIERFSTKEKTTIKQAYEEVGLPEDLNTETNISISEIYSDYNTIQTDKKAIEIIEQMKLILLQPDIDTITYKRLENELKALNIKPLTNEK